MTFHANHASVLPQDSAAVQILLEVCLPTSEEKQLGANTESLLRSIRGSMPGKLKQASIVPRASGGVEDTEPEGGLLSDLREVQCLICCLLHQMFIADPNIAKLVHFQVIRWGQGRHAAVSQTCRGDMLFLSLLKVLHSHITRLCCFPPDFTLELSYISNPPLRVTVQ